MSFYPDPNLTAEENGRRADTYHVKQGGGEPIFCKDLGERGLWVYGDGATCDYWKKYFTEPADVPTPDSSGAISEGAKTAFAKRCELIYRWRVEDAKRRAIAAIADELRKGA